MLVVKHLPKWSWAADLDKKAFRLPQHEFIDAHYLSPQPFPSKRVAIILDVDSHLDIDLMREIGMPLPRTFTGRPIQHGRHTVSISNRPHLIYWLDQPVWMNDRRQAAKYNDVMMRLAFLVGTICDVENINTVTTKNPAKTLYASEDLYWHVVKGDDRLWTLDELDEAITRCEKAPGPERLYTYDVQAKTSETCQTNSRPIYTDTRGPVPHLQRTLGANYRQHKADQGRNCEMWEGLRFVAYAYKAQAGSQEDLQSYMLKQCEIYNQTNFAHAPLPTSEMVSIAKSLARWTWRYYTGSAQEQKDRGVCRREGLIHAGMPKRQRQAVGGRYGAQKNADTKRQKILAALTELRAADKPIVISKLAKDLEVSRNTLKKYISETTEGVVQEADRATAPEVVKTVYIREGSLNKTPTPEEYGEPIEVEVAGKTVKLWPVAGQEGQVTDKNGVQMPIAYYEHYMKPKKPPDDIEVPACLQWW